MMLFEKIRVLVVDDSPFRREAIMAILHTDPKIQVVGSAADGRQALDKTLALRPKVITMDIQMPVMNGFEAIEAIMCQAPTSIVVTSGIDVKTVVKALSLGAMDFVILSADMDAMAKELIEKVKIASLVKPIRRIGPGRRVGPGMSVDSNGAFEVVAVGVSTGGPAALAQVFASLPPGLPIGMLVVQHMARGFIGGLVEHLRSQTRYDLRVAREGQAFEKGTVLFAPDDRHLRIGHDYRVELAEDHGLVGSYVPSIDVMMESVAQVYHARAVGVLMTGMGGDGVQGMKAIWKAGGSTIAQDEETSVVFGMNRMAIESGCVDRVVPLPLLGDEIARLCSCRVKHSAAVH